MPSWRRAAILGLTLAVGGCAAARPRPSTAVIDVSPRLAEADALI